MKLVLETNTYSDFMRGHPAIHERVRNAELIGLPATVVGELLSSDQHFRFIDGLSWSCPTN